MSAATLASLIIALAGCAIGSDSLDRNKLVAATAELRGITIWKIVDGRILEEWSSFDRLSLLRQLGLFPE